MQKKRLIQIISKLLETEKFQYADMKILAMACDSCGQGRMRFVLERYLSDSEDALKGYITEVNEVRDN